ncbi:MAG: D-3-phosphoglycerate dehydrogenase / 2-oxoglutarate reductase, partial [Microbacteriaceae bacterium]|nr:D-3-phosphoglycerate dehydrogenase / 2-oxoglutarate reductase [Microbacteriaceae bacterium]
MTKPIVLIAEQLSPATVDALGPDFDIRQVDGTDRPALLAALADADALLVRSATQVDEEAIRAARRLTVIARAGVGLDNVDIPAATKAGVMVVNAPTSNIVSAAELAIGHLLALARHLPEAHASLKAGEWKRSRFTGVELYDKTVGIVGLGRIGTLVAQRLAPFGVTLVAYDPYVTPARAQQLGVGLLPLDELMRVSDFITVHIPKTPETTGLIGAAQFELAKPELRIVNASRGGIIDESALAEALGTGRIAGAALDVFVQEPPQNPELLTQPKLQVTPHLGASTDEAQEKAGIAVARSVRLALGGELVPDAVNVAGGVIDPYVRPGIPLVEKLGQVFAGLADGPIASLDVEVRGELADYDVSVLKLAALKGVFMSGVSENVSYV